MAPSIRIVMLGTGDFALPTFVHLCDTGHRVERLITQPDRPQGRKQELIPSAIKQAAVARGIAVDQPEDVNVAESLEHMRAVAPDLLVTAAYGQILSAALLGIPRLGGINLHGSILPAYRGAAPVARAIEHGERETGVTVIQMTPRIDAGGMLAVARTPIGPDETAGALEARLAELGAPLVAEAIAALDSGTARVLPQEKARVTRAPKLKKEDGLIDWSKSAQAIHDLVRAMQPWPVADTYWQRSDPSHHGAVRLMIHATRPVEGHGPVGTVLEAEGDHLVIAAGAGAVLVLTLQREGKKPGPAAEFLRGNHVVAGDRMAGPSPAAAT
jgi:methionyl-tRNA formyltransferase